LWVWFS